MEFRVEPYVGVGLIRFGMTREAIRRVLARQVRAYVKWAGEPPIDISGGLHIEYDADGKCEAVEFYKPEDDPVLLETHLLQNSMGELKKWFMEIDAETQVDFGGLKSYKYGVGIWHEMGFEKPGETPNSVIVFKRGYYGL